MPYPGFVPPFAPEIPTRVDDRPLEIKAGDKQTVKVRFNKQTHGYRWANKDEGETEAEAILIVEPRK
jgi:hypothetical protein